MKNQRLYPDLEGPKYGIPFKVIGFQAKLEDREKYTGLIEIEVIKENKEEEWVTLHNRREYINWKSSFGESICKSLNDNGIKNRLSKVTSFKIKYLLYEDDNYI